MRKVLLGAGFVLAGLAGLAQAQGADPFKMQIAARQGIMAYRALQLGTLGAMAKGEVEYDAAKAQKAADNLLTAVSIDASMLFPKGSDSDAVEGTRALPAIWAEGSTIGAEAKAAVEAATALQAAAGKDLDSLKAAMGPMGQACTACHKAYRKSE